MAAEIQGASPEQCCREAWWRLPSPLQAQLLACRVEPKVDSYEDMARFNDSCVCLFVCLFVSSIYVYMSQGLCKTGS
jgi:hypothetical protein